MAIASDYESDWMPGADSSDDESIGSLVADDYPSTPSSVPGAFTGSLSAADRKYISDNGITPLRESAPAHICQAWGERLYRMRLSESGSAEQFKLRQWLETMSRIPFGNYGSREIDNPRDYLHGIKANMDKAVYGQGAAKGEILTLAAKWITGPTKAGHVFALHGPAGVGKTELVHRALGPSMGHPVYSISLGGASDASMLMGHDGAYIGGSYGRIIDAIISTGCMNPIIYLDELDKLSGADIAHKLIHLVDPVQNGAYTDAYLQVPIDLSGVTWVFSLNDVSRVNPILVNRIKIINLDDYSPEDKLIISRDYIWPGVLREYGLPEIQVMDSALVYLMNKVGTQSPGMRAIKASLHQAAGAINLARVMDGVDVPTRIGPNEIIRLV